MTTETILFLVHRLPYPPNKGDKVRSYHLLRHLAQRYRVALGTFVDDPADWPHVERLRALCAEMHVEPIARASRRWRGAAAALLTGEPLTLPYFRSSTLAEWVGQVVRRERIERAIAYSSPMAQYLLDLPVRSIVDFVDLDSAKWDDYARRRRWPVSSLYGLEARRLFAFERTVAERVAASVFVTRDEARLLSAAVPPCANRIVAIENGVDSEYFSPQRDFASPFERGEHAIVFTGSMDYWPNIDAVTWFAREVLPRVRQRDDRARFHIVGMNPDASVRALAGSSVRVTGRVDDVRPYLAHARVVVAPLRIARGIQNKILEAMAMGRPTVVTSGAARPLSAQPGIELSIADDSQDFASKVLEAMPPGAGEAMGRCARARIEADYAWAAKLSGYDALLAKLDAPQPASTAAAPSAPPVAVAASSQ
jgi:sugar transferase (PEP-CTERM/EpsH1 system associated)